MQLVKHKMCNVEFEMVDIKGKLYCSIGHLMEGFGVEEIPLKKAIQYKGSGRLTKQYLGDVIATSDLSIEDITMLKIKSADRNERLWMEKDLPDFAWMLETEEAKKVRESMLNIIKGEAVVTCIN